MVIPDCTLSFQALLRLYNQRQFIKNILDLRCIQETLCLPVCATFISFV